MKTRRISIVALIIGIIITISFRQYNFSNHLIINPIFSGTTMGTSYNIKIIDQISPKKYKEINSLINNLLINYNNQMSTWIDNSEINIFNRSTSLLPYKIDFEFYNIVKKALEISELSNGYYDPTIQPLYDLWGFGSGSTDHQINNFPSLSLIDNNLDKVGYKKIKTITWKSELRNLNNNGLQKIQPSITLNLGGIAKGAASDRIIYLLSGNKSNYHDVQNTEISNNIKKYQFKNIYVDIGGDVSVLGFNQDNKPWKIGIQMPSSSLFDINDLYGIISITNGSFATSGNYYNFKKNNDKKYAHIIDPKTGMAINSDLVSVSVYHPDGAYADGLATAIYVMGLGKGLDMIHSIEGEAMIIKKNTDNTFSQYFSTNFILKTNFKKINHKD